MSWAGTSTSLSLSLHHLTREQLSRPSISQLERESDLMRGQIDGQLSPASDGPWPLLAAPSLHLHFWAHGTHTKALLSCSSKEGKGGQRVAKREPMETPFLYVLSFPTHPVARLRKWPGCPSLPPKPAALSISQPPFFSFDFLVIPPMEQNNMPHAAHHLIYMFSWNNMHAHLIYMFSWNNRHAWTTKSRRNKKLIA